MARSNPEYESAAESQATMESEPESPSTVSISTSRATRPFESKITHTILFTLTTLNVYHPDHQDRVYIVRPAQIWNSLNRHRDCIITTPIGSSLTLALHTDISVRRPNSQGRITTWYARILEIRGSSAEHVYFRIFWYYTPVQLPPGIHINKEARRNGFRKGKGELREGEVLPSNEMGVVSAADVVGKVEVVVGRKADGNGGGVEDGVLWRENRYDFWEAKVFGERHVPGVTTGGAFEEQIENGMG